MKIRRIILSLLTVVLVAAILIGSTGFTIVIKSCHSSGISASTDLLKTTDSCCTSETSDCPVDPTESMGSVCCTFETAKMSLPAYVLTINTSLVSPAEIQSATDIFPAPSIQELKIYPEYIIHNKHGGRFILTSNCQFLI